MPIDLKWVRQDPQKVRKWQNIRKLSHRFAEHDSDSSCSDLVDVVIRKDELCRERLQYLQEKKRILKQIQYRLKPISSKSKNTKTEKEISESSVKESRQDLIKEKKLLEEKIREAEALWRDSLKDTQDCLAKLASPVTENEHVDDVFTAIVPPLPSLLKNGTHLSQFGIDLKQAWKQYTLRHFAAYPWVEFPLIGIPVIRKTPDSHSPSFCIDPDMAHALWCCRGYENDLNICKICQVASTDSSPDVMLPTWIRLMMGATKSIWGDKELPRYAAVWSSNNIAASTHTMELQQVPCLFSLDLVALVASSLVDAREIQANLVEELSNYYRSLIINEQHRHQHNRVSNQVQLLQRVVPARDLNGHEWSRIEIFVQLQSKETLSLGCVSHWGDAISRACEMTFAGGGVGRAGRKSNKFMRNAAKEYVHVVQASVVDVSTWNKILHANCSNDSSSRGGIVANVPPVLLPYLIRTREWLKRDGNSRNKSGATAIPLEELVFDSHSKKKKKMAFFGIRGIRDQTYTQQPVMEMVPAFVEKPKFPPSFPSSMPKEQLQQQMRLEKLSCPFDFLFDF